MKAGHSLKRRQMEYYTVYIWTCQGELTVHDDSLGAKSDAASSSSSLLAAISLLYPIFVLHFPMTFFRSEQASIDPPQG